MQKVRAPLYTISDALPDLVPFERFKKRKKQPWTSVTFSKVRDFICTQSGSVTNFAWLSVRLLRTFGSNGNWSCYYHNIPKYY